MSEMVSLCSRVGGMRQWVREGAFDRGLRDPSKVEQGVAWSFLC